MKPHSINTSLEYLRRIAPEHIEVAQEMIEVLPAGWYNVIPASCRHPKGGIPWLLIPHALLALIDPVRFPPSHRTIRLSEFIHQLLDAAEQDKHTSRKDTTMTDEFFTKAAEVPTLAGNLALLQHSVVRKVEFEATAQLLTATLLEEHSTLEVYVKIENVAEILDVALGQIREQAILAAGIVGEQVFGATVLLKPLPREWEYDDAEVRRLESEKVAVEAQLKVRKKYLENLKTEVADTATGEIIRPARCIAEGVTIQVTF